MSYFVTVFYRVNNNYRTSKDETKDPTLQTYLKSPTGVDNNWLLPFEYFIKFHSDEDGRVVCYVPFYFFCVDGTPKKSELGKESRLIFFFNTY